jgi:hypothetical protein
MKKSDLTVGFTEDRGFSGFEKNQAAVWDLSNVLLFENYAVT